MSWPHFVGFGLAAVGAVGFCLMVAAFALIAFQGGWQQAIQQTIAEGRWPLPRRLLLAGASLALIFALGVVILRAIAGPFPWSNVAHQAPALMADDAAPAAEPALISAPPADPVAAAPPLVQLPAPANGHKYTAPELKRLCPQLMAEVARLKDRLPMSKDGLPDFQALATRKVEELTNLAQQLSRTGRAQFRALIEKRVEYFSAFERFAGGPAIAQKLLAALDSAERGETRRFNN